MATVGILLSELRAFPFRFLESLTCARNRTGPAGRASAERGEAAGTAARWRPLGSGFALLCYLTGLKMDKYDEMTCSVDKLN